MNREPIYAALFALVSNSASFATASRRVKNWANVPAGNQPALFLTQTGESISQDYGKPPIHRLHADLVLYANDGDPASTPSSSLNPLVDAVEAALSPSITGQPQTLGGLVERCYISGKIQTEEGALGNQAVAIIPIEIVVP